MHGKTLTLMHIYIMHVCMMHIHMFLGHYAYMLDVLLYDAYICDGRTNILSLGAAAAGADKAILGV